MPDKDHPKHEHAAPHHAKLTLPVSVVSPSEALHLLNELEQIDEALLQLEIRKAGSNVNMPKTSRLMDKTVEHNKLNLLKKEDRVALKQYLELVKEKAPQLHFSFGADPTPAFMEKLVRWLRENIHAHALVTVGLQPQIGAGCILRTTNKQFDFSLGRTIESKRELLMKQLLSESASSVPAPAEQH